MTEYAPRFLALSGRFFQVFFDGWKSRLNHPLAIEFVSGETVSKKMMGMVKHVISLSFIMGKALRKHEKRSSLKPLTVVAIIPPEKCPLPIIRQTTRSMLAWPVGAGYAFRYSLLYIADLIE